MSFFKSKALEAVPDFPKLEKAILRFWEKHKILEKYLKRNARAKKRFRFLDGPITANNPMGVHHAWGRTLKDLFQRVKTMQGFRQRYQNGFDAQGLWVEVEVEKELGFKTKKDIERYGIAKFVEKCKARVRKFAKIQTEQSKRLGYFMDWEHSYITMSEENNYAIWHFLKRCWEKGHLYKGRDVVPWCPRCGTAISQHEILTEEYQELSHLSAYVRYPVRGRGHIYLLVWTTTPWTLPVNVAVAVNPELSYVEVQKGEARYLLAEKRIEVLGGGKILKRLKGKELLGIQYEGAFDDLPAVKGAAKHHRVVAWDGVGEEEGTGLVHIAPGAGEEDFDVGKEEGLPAHGPLDEAGAYVSGYGFLSGKNAKEATPLIVDDLEKRGFLFAREEFRHRYPVCWRCKTEIVFRLVDEWYISMEELRPRLMEIAKTVRWIPSFGLERELDWLKNMGDWLISKKRYWGLALPIFACAKCGHFEVVGSKEELRQRAVAGWKAFEGKSPHRPYVDAVKIKCSKCGAVVSRIPDVGSPWLDAGIVPFSTIKYFADRTYWREWFPAEFITESFPGQFKNWFYSLLVMSAVLENRAPFETVLGYGTVLDEKGEEMHKSKGNMIEFNEAAEKVGADILRVTYTLQNPSLNLLFGWNGLEQGKRDVLLLLWNVFRFFVTYSKIDKWSPKKRAKSRHMLDLWILASLHQLIETVTRGLDAYDPSGPMRAVQAFISDLSTWYLRRSRKRRDAAFYRTMYEVLLTLSKLMAPFLPYVTEAMYQELREARDPESPHLCDWPKANRAMIDKRLLQEMAKVRALVSQALSLRMAAGIKIRQPLASVTLAARIAPKSKELLEILRDEINVKRVLVKSSNKPVVLDTKLTPELREEGEIRELIRVIQDLRKDASYQPGEKITLLAVSKQSKSRKILERWQSTILDEVDASRLLSEKRKADASGTVKISQETLWVGVKKENRVR